MADRLLHFAFGMVVGMAVFMPHLVRSWISGRKLSTAFARLLVASYGLGIFAVVPNMLRHAGLPRGLCSGWWMNVFLLNPLIDRIRGGGMLIGQLVIVVCFILQYILLILAVNCRQRDRPPNIP